MIEGFAFSLLVIVAFFTTFARHRVVELVNRPGGDDVTRGTITRRLNVQFILAGCCFSVVAAKTIL